MSPAGLIGLAVGLLIYTVYIVAVLPVPGAAPEVGPAQVAEGMALEVDARATADELFNQVVDAAAAGDSMHVFAFLPVAIAAYQEAKPADPDGLFHFSTLLRLGKQAEASYTSASMILQTDPNHLLGLAATAEAAVELGHGDEAAVLYARLLDVYDEQVARGLPEYVGHADLMERIRAEASAYLGTT